MAADDLATQGAKDISSHSIDLDIPAYSCFSTRRVMIWVNLHSAKLIEIGKTFHVIFYHDSRVEQNVFRFNPQEFMSYSNIFAI